MIKAGDLVFVRSKGFIGWLIRTVSTGKLKSAAPNHVAIVWSIVGDDVLLLEATFKGVRIASLDIYKNEKVWLKRMREPRDIKKGLEWALSQENLPYDRIALIGIFARSFCRLLGKRIYKRSKMIRNFLDSKTKFFCSEYLSIIGGMTGVRLWPAHDSECTPWDLFRSLEIEDVE